MGVEWAKMITPDGPGITFQRRTEELRDREGAGVNGEERPEGEKFGRIRS